LADELRVGVGELPSCDLSKLVDEEIELLGRNALCLVSQAPRGGEELLERLVSRRERVEKREQIVAATVVEERSGHVAHGPADLSRRALHRAHTSASLRASSRG